MSLDQELGLDETIDADTDTSDVETFEETQYSVSRVSRHSKIIDQVSTSLLELDSADETRAQSRSDPPRVTRTLSGTNRSLLDESEPSAALVWSTIARKSCQLELDSGVGSTMASHLPKPEAGLRAISFCPKPINSLDLFGHLLNHCNNIICNTYLVSVTMRAHFYVYH